jgi:aminopeptidase N
MKTLKVTIPDEVYERVEQYAAARGATIDEEVVHLLESLPDAAEEARLEVARARMAELFRTVKSFRMGKVIPREELYERGRLR